MAIEYNFKYMPLVGKLSGKSMAEQTETAINEIAKIVNDNTAQAEIINTLAEEANTNSVEALEKANEALETSGRVYIKETGAVDLDSYCESQLIYINNIFSQNLPVESKGFLEVKTNDDKTQATQVFIDDLNKEVYTRSGTITETQVGDITTYTASYGAWNKSASTNYVENMVLIRQNFTAYSVGDIARSTALASYMLLECTSAGTTGVSEPSFSGADVGDVITDGSASWTIIEYTSTDYVDDSIADLKNVYLPANYLPLSGGTMTGAIISSVETVLKRPTTDAFSILCGSTAHSTGAHLRLYGKDAATYGGAFLLYAIDANNTKLLLGTPNGSLTWDGKILSAPSGRILIASGTAAKVTSTYVDIASVTANVNISNRWLVIGHTEISVSIADAVIVQQISNTPNSSSRYNGNAGGGAVCASVATISSNTTFTLRGYSSSTTEFNFTGQIYAIPLM